MKYNYEKAIEYYLDNSYKSIKQISEIFCVNRKTLARKLKQLGIDISRVPVKEFINISNKIHNNKYDYSLSVYSKYSDKIKIICPIHGEFEQQVGNHLQGKGCSKCKNDKLAFNRKDSFENFVNKANSVHNKLYDYEKVNYINQLTKIIIICPKHGEFEQTANAHLRGQGCPKCNNSKGEIMIYN